MTIEEHTEAAANVLHGSSSFDGSYTDACNVSRHIVSALLPLIAAELAGVARDPKLIDQVSRGLAAGWRGNPNMSGDDRDFMHPSMRRRHDEKSADACEFIALAIEAHTRKMWEA